MGVLCDLVIAKPEQAAEIIDYNLDTKFTSEYIGNGLTIDWFMALLCVLDDRTPEGIGDEFPVVDGEVRATIVSDALVKLASKIDDDSIPDIAADWFAWMNRHGAKVVGANELPEVRRIMRRTHREWKAYERASLKRQSKKKKEEADKSTREGMQKLLHILRDLSKKTVSRKKALFFRQCV